jgi:potassium-transporting ATPase KdpC subunit
MVMFAQLRPAVISMIAFTVLTGAAYPAIVTGIAQGLFPSEANGSLIVRDGKVVGSALIGQNFASARYFHPRPSATSAPDPKDPTKTVDAPYNASNSSGSNLGPINGKLVERLKTDTAALRTAGATGSLPVDAVTTSASGLDPDISPETARLQVAGVAKERGLSEARVRALVDGHVEGRSLGLIGEPRVNVLQLNLDLDRLAK